MDTLTYDSINIDEAIPPFSKPPINRTTLALFAGASNDHNPIHIDIDFARQAGMDDVFAHGMLSMAYLGQILTNWIPQHNLRSYGVRFGAITHLGDEISCKGTVVEKFEQDGEKRVRLDLQAANQDGEVKLQGEAIVALD